MGLGYWWLAGSRHDPARQPGLAHCLEHLWFRGPGLAERIDALGGRVNAETGRETCGLHGVSPATEAGRLAVLLGELLHAPAPDETALAAERPALLAEQASLQADPGERAVQRAIAQAWHNHPLAHPPEGTAEGLNRITAAALAEYRVEHLHAGRLVAVLLGDWPATARDRVERELAALPAGRPAAGGPPDFHAARDPIPKGACHLAWALPVPGGDVALGELAAELLAGGLGARLFRRLREERGWVYDVVARLERARDAALCVIATSAPAGLAKAVTAAVAAELDALAASGPGAAELAAAQGRLAAGRALAGLAPEATMQRAALDTWAPPGPEPDPPALRALFAGPRVQVAEPA